jgi:hypothetical protein
MTKRPFPVLSALLALLSLLAPATAPADDHAGLVIGLLGKVTAQKGDSRRPLALSSKVYQGETVVTGPEARVQIMFTDDTLLAQGPDSRVRLADYIFEPAKAGMVSFNLEEGSFRVISGRMLEEGRGTFTLNTPLSAIGIHGTMLGVVVGKDMDTILSLDLEPGHHVLVDSLTGQGRPQRIYNDLMAVDVTAAGVDSPRLAGVEDIRNLRSATGIGLGGSGLVPDSLDPEADAGPGAAAGPAPDAKRIPVGQGLLPGFAGPGKGRARKPDTPSAGPAWAAPGRSGSAPGRSGSTPGRSGSAPGRSGSAPGRGVQGPAWSGNPDHPGSPASRGFDHPQNKGGQHNPGNTHPQNKHLDRLHKTGPGK